MITDLPDLALLAFYHGHHAGGMSDWIAHMTISAMIHAVIYAFMFRLMHELTLEQDAMQVCAVLVLLFMWGRARDRRRW